ncbi:MAG: hypothetical protein ABIK65_10735 [Candidatus Eisenbacteria bacterium]
MIDRIRKPAVLALLGLFAATSASAQGYVPVPDAEYTNVNLVGLMINNNGFLGTNLPGANGEPANFDPSFEYPLGTNIERMIRGGVWIGAVNIDGDSLVSTATIDGAFNDPISSEYREGTLILERSSLRNSPDYDPEAISENDLVCFFVDTDSTIQSRHRPINIRVDMEVYAWSFQPVNHFVILSYWIKNISRNRLQDIYVGMYAELLVCSKDFTRPFPNECFDTKHVQYWEDDRLVGCHSYQFAQTVLAGWGGYSLLGSSPDSLTGKTITFDWWEWDPDLADRETDADRYVKLSSGVVDSTITDDGTSSSPDPVELLSVGPYRFLDPGDSLNVVFAYVGGRNDEDFQFRASWAQKTYDSNYKIPEPPPSPRIHVDPAPNSVRVFWDASPETIPDPVLNDSLDFQGYRLYLSRDNSDYTLVGEYDVVDTIGFNTGFASVAHDTVIDGWGYNYVTDIPSLKDGFKYFVAVTSYDKGDKTAGVPPLESGVSQNRVPIVPGPEGGRPGEDRPDVIVFPNPYRGEALWDGRYARDRLIYFANLPRKCTIRIYTIAGDLVDTIEFESDEYHAADVSAVNDPDFAPPELSGGLAAWDLLTSESQTVASGLYVFSVEDRETGDVEVGKFMVIR